VEKALMEIRNMNSAGDDVTKFLNVRSLSAFVTQLQITTNNTSFTCHTKLWYRGYNCKYVCRLLPEMQMALNGSKVASEGNKCVTELPYLSVLNLLGKDGLKIGTQLIHNIYKHGEWYRNFIYVAKIALKKKSEATKSSDRRTVGLIALASKLATRLLTRRIEKKIEDVLVDDPF
jgi:hypothetical protein